MAVFTPSRTTGGALRLSPHLEGVAALTKQLDALGKLEDGKAIRAAVRAASRIVVKEARARVPIGTRAHRTYTKRLVAPGFAQRSIRSIVVLSKDKQKATMIVGVRAEAFYATIFVELGTSKMAKQPWLRPAFVSTASAQQTAIRKSLQATIDKIAKKGT